jgi:hypothetical protein
VLFPDAVSDRDLPTSASRVAGMLHVHSCMSIIDVCVILGVTSVAVLCTVAME